MTTTRTPAGDELRRQASAHEQEKVDSFERCDTDGFLSQWAHGCLAAEKRFAAEIADNGGVWTFPVLLTLEGEFVPAIPIRAKYGMCWMLLDADGNSLGQFVPYRPKRADTLGKRGYREAKAIRPARARLSDGTTPRPYASPTEPWHKPPATILPE